MTQTTINLLPWREEQRERNKLIFFIGLGASVVLALIVCGVTYFVLENFISHQTQRNNIIKKEIARYNRQIKEIKRLKAVRETLIARMNIIQQLQENRPEIVHFFDELIKIVPKSIYLMEVTRASNAIMLTGHADTNSSVSILMRNIRENFWVNKPVLEEVEEVTDKEKKRLYNQFRVRLILKPKNKLEKEAEL